MQFLLVCALVLDEVNSNREIPSYGPTLTSVASAWTGRPETYHTSNDARQGCLSIGKYVEFFARKLVLSYGRSRRQGDAKLCRAPGGKWCAVIVQLFKIARPGTSLSGLRSLEMRAGLRSRCVRVYARDSSGCTPERRVRVYARIFPQIDRRRTFAGLPGGSLFGLNVIVVSWNLKKL